MKLKVINKKTKEIFFLNDLYELKEFFMDEFFPWFDFYRFTGFQDSKSNDIYEGDILSYWTKTDEGLIQYKCKVFWNEKSGQWDLDLSFNKNFSNSNPLFKELMNFNYEIITPCGS